MFRAGLCSARYCIRGGGTEYGIEAHQVAYRTVYTVGTMLYQCQARHRAGGPCNSGGQRETPPRVTEVIGPLECGACDRVGWRARDSLPCCCAEHWLQSAGDCGDVCWCCIIEAEITDATHQPLRQGQFDPPWCRYRCAAMKLRKTAAVACVGPLTKGSRILVKFGSKSKVPLAGFSGRRHQSIHVQGTEHIGTHRQADRERQTGTCEPETKDSLPCLPCSPLLITYLPIVSPFLSSAGLTDFLPSILIRTQQEMNLKMTSEMPPNSEDGLTQCTTGPSPKDAA